MTLQECYVLMGADYREVSERLGKEPRILKYLGKFRQDSSYSSLCKALEEKNWKEAFACAHNLKGMCLNLGLTRLGSSAGALCEALRGGAPASDISSMEAALKADYAQMELAVDGLFGETEAFIL